MNCQSFSLGARWHSAWLGSVPWRLERRRNPAVSARSRSNGVLRRVKRPIGCGPSGMGRVLSPLVAVPSGTSKTYRSLLLAVSRSTISRPSEYMILELPFCDHSKLCKDASQFAQPPKRSGSNTGLREGWYPLSSSECIACWLF
jgi:hypothetical protein